MQEFLSKFFVLGDGFGDGAGGINFGRLDAALFATPAQLHQRAFC